MSDDITDIVGGDNRRAHVLRDNLTKLADGPDPLLREMATGVLNGDVRLRDAAASDAYSDVLAGTFHTFWTAYQDMTPEERADLVAQGNDHIARADQARLIDRHDGGRS